MCVHRTCARAALRPALHRHRCGPIYVGGLEQQTVAVPAGIDADVLGVFEAVPHGWGTVAGARLSHFEERLTQILYAGKKDSRVVIARSLARGRSLATLARDAARDATLARM